MNNIKYIQQSILLLALTGLLLISGCGGSGGLASSGGIIGTGSIVGSVPGTIIEAYGDQGEYFRVTSVDNNSDQHPFRLELPPDIGFHLVMIINEGTPDEIIIPIAFEGGDKKLLARIILNAGDEIDLGHIALYKSRAEVPANIDPDEDGVLDEPFVLDKFGANNPLQQVDADDDGIDDYDDDDHGDPSGKHDDDPQDHDNDGVPNKYDNDFTPGPNDDDQDGIDDDDDENPGNIPPGTGGIGAAGYTLLAWNDLGMHCADGKDYSVFALLPPFNNLHAQLIHKNTNRLVESGVKVTFKAAPSLTGSMNTSSADKTNFWDYEDKLFGQNLAPDTGLTGIKTQSLTPQQLQYEHTYRWWQAEGIPILPFNDDGTKDFYPMVEVTAMDEQSGAILGTTTVVLPVSDEMDCRRCHGSGSDGAGSGNGPGPGKANNAEPNGGWVWDPDADKDYKRNILLLHDQLHGTSLTENMPVLCASCHRSNALPGTGINGVQPLTQAIHASHANVIDPQTNQALNSSQNRGACYACHPGATTNCLRGAMGNGEIQCQDCHGPMTAVGNPKRQGWIDQPDCQSCHQEGKRYMKAVVDNNGQLRHASDNRFGTNSHHQEKIRNLYRFSSGHGGVQCEGCHGATHAIYPSSHTEDNLQSISVQGYAGTVSECTACHASVPLTANGGPHGMHTTGQAWVNEHGEFAEHDYTGCAACHGDDYLGSPLSAVPVARQFRVEDKGTKQFTARYQVGCYDCHDGPDPEDDDDDKDPEEED